MRIFSQKFWLEIEDRRKQIPHIVLIIPTLCVSSSFVVVCELHVLDASQSQRALVLCSYEHTMMYDRK